MSLTDRILRVANCKALKGLLGRVNTRLRPRRPVRFRIMGRTVYAASLDRIAALMLWLRGGSPDFGIGLWRSLIRPGMVVADVGANLGIYSLLASRWVGSEGSVHSFEPDPENFALLTRNVRANGCENVTTHQAAVADEVGEITLFVRPEHHGDHRIYNDGAGGRGQIRVPLTTLDEALGKTGRLDVVKLDIQGVEWRAIAGMRQLLAANPRMQILAEFWPEGMRQSGKDPAEFLDELADCKLQVRHVNGERRELESLSSKDLLVTAERSRFTNVLLSVS